MEKEVLPGLGSCVKVVKMREQFKRASLKNIEGKYGRVLSAPVADPKGQGTHCVVKLDGEDGVFQLFVDELEILWN
jgi:hypothetical protein